MCVCVCVCVCVSVYMYVCMYVYMYVCMYICMYVCMYVRHASLHVHTYNVYALTHYRMSHGRASTAYRPLAVGVVIT